VVEFIAEFTTNHMGNLNVLLEMVEQAKWAGADWIKMQKKDVASFYTQKKLMSKFKSPYGKTYHDYRKIFEFGAESFHRFDKECRKFGIPWYSTAQDIPSLNFFLTFFPEMERYKVASVNSNNDELLDYISWNIPTDKTLVISVAGLTLDQIDTTLNKFPNHNIILQHCVAEYPCPLEHLRLGNITVLKEKFIADSRISVGYSGHEEGIGASLAAIRLGAETVERHFCLSRHTFVHHIECSLEPQEFKRLTTLGWQEQLDMLDLDIPPDAFSTSFGMSAREKDFLIEGKYGKKYLKDGSKWAGQQ